MNIKYELGIKLKQLRKKHVLTQEKFSEMIDISSKNLSNIELGISFPKPETLEKILKSLNVTTEEFFANNHIKSNAELIKCINEYVSNIKNDTQKLMLIYRITRDLSENI